MSEQLLPCPFCGGEAEIDRSAARFDYGIGGPYSVMDYGYEAYCTKCDAGAHTHNVPPSTPEEAAKEWNRRFPVAPQADWTAAPEWARWWAIDADGQWFWHQVEPIMHQTVSACRWDVGCLNGIPQGDWLFGGHIDIPLGVDWRTLKERRP